MLAEARKSAPTPGGVPEAEVRAWFDAHRADYKDPERRRVSVIVADATRPPRRDVLAAAKKAPTPAQWGELVRAKSIDPQARAERARRSRGRPRHRRRRPAIARGENPRVPDEVRAAAFEIAEVGGVADKVVAAQDKLLRRAPRRRSSPPHERTYAEAERAIRVKLAQEKLRAKEDELDRRARRSRSRSKIDEAALANGRSVDMGDGATRDAGRDAGRLRRADGRARHDRRRSSAMTRSARATADARWRSAASRRVTHRRRSRRRALELTPEELEGARRAEREGLPIAITPYYLVALRRARSRRARSAGSACPRVDEAHEVAGRLVDPLGEVAHEVAPHLVRRYPDRVAPPRDRSLRGLLPLLHALAHGRRRRRRGLARRARARVRVDRARTPRSATSS